MNTQQEHIQSSSILESLFLALPQLSSWHVPNCPVYNFLKNVARLEIENLFSSEEPRIRKFMPFGDLVFPYHNMGAIDSLNLFDLNELIIFSFYWVNRARYRKVLDLGANIGLHSVILSKCGFRVCAYEPDPKHFEILKRNFALNNCSHIEAFNVAISNVAGEREFVRVLGNTTASHLAGSKSNPYGELERFPVKVEAIANIISNVDLLKVDVEGHEKEILLDINPALWLSMDALVEVENENNAHYLFEHFMSLGVNLFSQKTNWQRVLRFGDMPTSYQEGTLFVTQKNEIPWC